MIEGSVYTGGFASPAYDSAHAFRAAMNAMARPGSIEAIFGAQAPAPLSVAAGTLLLTLCDPDTSVALGGAHDCESIRQWITFHTGATFAGPHDADFVVGTWEALTPLSTYKIGTSEYPDRAATLIIEREELTPTGAMLSGPGIKTTARLNLPKTDAFAANRQLFPLGVDCFFTAGERVAALPRSTTVMEAV